MWTLELFTCLSHPMLRILDVFSEVSGENIGQSGSQCPKLTLRVQDDEAMDPRNEEIVPSDFQTHCQDFICSYW